MALYDGFFDAEYNEETGKFDREYDSEDFTDYFGQIVGSGVCVNGNPDSCKVTLESGQALVNAGYLFIQGYWLRITDEPYAIPLTSINPLAIVAYLNMGKKMIELEARPVAESYPYALCLGIVDPANREVTDTRYNIDICGVIDSAGGLSRKAAYAVEYIDKHVENRLKQMEDNIAEQDKKLDDKMEDAQAVLDKLTPLPVGAIRFSANADLGEEWLECNGQFVSKEDYPKLVELLQNPKVGLDNLTVLPQVLTPTSLCGSFVFDGFLWVMTDEPKLYGLSLSGGPTKEIAITIPSDTKINRYGASTLSLVDLNGTKSLFFFDDPNIFGSTIKIKYYYFHGFRSELESITFTEDTITGTPNVMVAEINYTYVVDKSGLGYRPVVVFDSVPYVALGHIVMVKDYDSTVNKAPNTVLGAKIFVVAALKPENAELHYYLMETAWNSNHGSVSNGSFDFKVSDYTYFSEENGGALFTSSINYAYELTRLEGDKRVELVRASTAPNNTKVGVLKENLMLLDIVLPVSTYPEPGSSDKCRFTYVDLDSAKSFDKEVTLSASVTYSSEFYRRYSDKKDFFYLKDNGVWAFFQYGYIIFISDPLDSPDVGSAVFDIRDQFKTNYSNISLDYDAGSHTLYLTGVSASYNIKAIAMHIPPGYSPIDGAKLPTLSLSKIPAYIKAKETEQ